MEIIPEILQPLYEKAYRTSAERYRVDPEYRKNHLKYMQEKVQCECGSFSNRCHLTTHKKTKKHKQFIYEKERKALEAEAEKILDRIIVHMKKQ